MALVTLVALVALVALVILAGRLLALHSLQRQEEEEGRLGDRAACGKTALETLRLFHDQQEMDAFMESDQVNHNFKFDGMFRLV